MLERAFVSGLPPAEGERRRSSEERAVQWESQIGIAKKERQKEGQKTMLSHFHSLCVLVLILLSVLAASSSRLLPASLSALRLEHAPSPPLPLLHSPSLIVCTHDFEHVDLLLMAKEAKVIEERTGIRTSFVVADLTHNHAFCGALHGGGCIPVRGGTVQKVEEELRSRRGHVCLFLYRRAAGTGAAFMAASAPKVILARVVSKGLGCLSLSCGESVPSCVSKTFGKTFRVEWEEWEEGGEGGEGGAEERDASRTMLELKRALYPGADDSDFV